MKREILNVLFALVLVLSLGLVIATPAGAVAPTTYNVIPFSLGTDASGVGAWTSAQHHTGSSSAKLTAPTAADYARVKLAIDNVAFGTFAAPSFYYRIGADAVATTEDIGATWPMYERTGTTVAQGYLSPYPVIYITNGTTNHFIMGQPWAESTKVGWTLWNNASASTVTTQALWHNEAFDDPGIGGSIPAGWGPLSYWTGTAYTGYTVVGFGVGLGYFAVTGQQEAYVDDITAGGTTYNLEGTSTDYSTFQAAINAATAGDTINVYAGLYNAASGETFPIEVNVADLTIRSVSGAATTIITPASTDQSSFEVTAAGVTIGGSSAGFTIGSGGRAGIYADVTGGDGITVQGCIFKSYGDGESRGMWFEKLWDEALITGNSFTTPKVGTGIMVVNADGATISNNTVATGTIKYSFLTFKAEAFYPDRDGTTAYAPPYNEFVATTASTINDVTITGNSITGVWQSGRDRVGIAFAASTKPADHGMPQSQDLTIDVDGVTISGNTFTHNNVGIGIDGDETADDFTVAHIYGVEYIQIVNNSFDGNDLYAVYNGQATAVDAENNWWGNASGPQRPDLPLPYISYGAIISTNVNFQSWLLAAYTGATPATYDLTLALKDGWTLVSVDREVTTGTNWVGTDNLTADTTVKIMAFKYDADPSSDDYGYTQVTLATQLTSVDAYYVKTNGGGSIGLIYSTAAPGVVTKNLYEGWNTISCAGETDAYTLLSQLRYAEIGTEEGVGLTSLVSQGDYNQFSNSFYVTLVTPAEWLAIDPVDDSSEITLSPFDGYWVYLNADKIFGVIPDTVHEPG